MATMSDWDPPVSLTQRWCWNTLLYVIVRDMIRSPPTNPRTQTHSPIPAEPSLLEGFCVDAHDSTGKATARLVPKHRKRQGTPRADADWLARGWDGPGRPIRPGPSTLHMVDRDPARPMKKAFGRQRAKPVPAIYQRMGRDPLRLITVSAIPGPARSGPSYFHNHLPGPSRLGPLHGQRGT